jgi:chitinase
MKKILIIIAFFCLLVISSACTPDNDDNDGDDPIVPTLSVSSERLSINIGETGKIDASISGTTEMVTMLFTSLDTAVATVDATGLVTAVSEGETVIEVTISEYPDVKTTVTVTVIDAEKEAEQEAQEIIAATIAELDAMIPATLSGNVELPRFMRGYSIQLTWTSSKPSAVSTTGLVIRRKTDQSVQLQAVLKHMKTGIEGAFTKTVTVEKYELRNLAGKKPVFAYYYQGSTLSDDDLDKIDVINYSFGYILNNQLSLTHLTNLANLVNKAHSKGVRFVISVGGWGASGFSPMAANPENRAKFVQSVVKAMNDYALDGIDLDWEYPTRPIGSDPGLPADKVNFTYLVKELREALDAVDQEYLLTAAFPAGSWGANNYYEINKINDCLDYFHLMTYDMISYDNPSRTSHHTNLYASQYASSSTASADSAVKAYVAAGADKSKITIGGAFYGHIGTVSGNTSGNGMGLPSVNFTEAINFARIHTEYLTNPAFTYYFDDVAKAAWIFDGTTFISFDDPASLAFKCEYVIDEGLGGIMFWQLGGDYNGVLVSAIYNALNK